MLFSAHPNIHYRTFILWVKQDRLNDTGSAILIFSAKESKNGIPHSRYFRDEQVCQIFFQDAEQTFDIYNVNTEVTIQ